MATGWRALVCFVAAGLALRAITNHLFSSYFGLSSRPRIIATKPRAHIRANARIAGLGSCGVDFIAQVAEYPDPDDKIRTKDFKVFGGGNAANTLCALGRLGNQARLISKIGTDTNGDIILKEAKSYNVNSEFILRSDKTPSPFTYVIVDEKSQTRTCIHTAATEELIPEEMNEGMLDGCTWLHLDGRHTPAATRLAEIANKMRIPVSLDVEKERPGLHKLLPKADILFTNSKYPLIFTESEGGIVESMKVMLNTFPRAKFIVSTQGSEGSIAVVRATDSKLESEIIRCEAWKIDAEDVIDTTGAGDAFIAGAIHMLVREVGLKDAMRFGSYVAAKKLTALGAREGLPTLENAKKEVLSGDLAPMASVL